MDHYQRTAEGWVLRTHVDHGALTADLAPSGTAIGTEAMTRAVLARLEIDCIAVELRD